MCRRIIATNKSLPKKKVSVLQMFEHRWLQFPVWLVTEKQFPRPDSTPQWTDFTHALVSPPHINNTAEQRERTRWENRIKHQQSFSFFFFPFRCHKLESNSRKRFRTDESRGRSGRDDISFVFSRLMSVRSRARRSTDWQRKSLAVARKENGAARSVTGSSGLNTSPVCE